ncbi:MAG: hypothetical protein AAB656_03370 [Patescibacteria group bacterium]
MAGNINLIPIELSPQSGAAKTAKLLKRVSIVYGSIVVLLLIGASAYIFLFQFQINSIKGQNEALSAQVTKLESAEQKTALTRDRLVKIKGILASGSGVEKGLLNLDKVISILPVGVIITNAEVDNARTKFSVTGGSSLSVASFLSNLVAQKIYNNLILKTFSYNPGSGYVVSFEVLEAK